MGAINVRYPIAFEDWARGQKFPKTGDGRLAKHQCYLAWCEGGSVVLEKVEKEKVEQENKPNGDLTNAQLNQKIDLMASNIQGQMFAGMDKQEKDLEEVKDLVEALRAQVQTLQQNLTNVASRPYLDMTRY